MDVCMRLFCLCCHACSERHILVGNSRHQQLQQIPLMDIIPGKKSA
jgi:hypothetical protein